MAATRARHLVPMVLLGSAPAVVVLVALMMTRHLGVGVGLGALLGVLGLTTLLLRPLVVELSQIATYVRALSQGDEPPPPQPQGRLAEEVMAAVGLLRKSWRQSDAELRALLASTETILDSLPDPLFLLDRQRRIGRANLAARHLFGDELNGRELASVLRTPQVLGATDRVIAGGHSETLEFILAGAMERSFRAHVMPLPARSVVGTVAMLALNDLTAEKRISQMRTDFIANASHELRTPLSALLGFIDTLRGPARDDPEAQERFLAIMSEQASRMSRLANDLLSLSRIELNEHTQPSERVDVAKLIEDVCDGLELHAGRRGMRIDITKPDTLPQVLGHPDELSQVFQNLVDNALKYGREGTPVEVVIDRVERSPALGRTTPHGILRVAVRDHGEGIGKEHLPRLTERFYRVDTARSRKLGGTGLGLAIVKHIVNRHRGALTIDSTVGDGSVFTVYLPAAKAIP